MQHSQQYVRKCLFARTQTKSGSDASNVTPYRHHQPCIIRKGGFEYECATPIEARSLVKIIGLHVLKIEHPVTCLATVADVYTTCAVLATIFSTGAKFRPV